jgi:hypothetical protein
VPVQRAMMKATNRNRELIADLASERTRLRKAKMVRIGGFAATHHARQLGYEFEVVPVAQANGLARRREANGAGCLGGSR